MAARPGNATRWEQHVGSSVAQSGSKVVESAVHSARLHWMLTERDCMQTMDTSPQELIGYRAV